MISGSGRIDNLGMLKRINMKNKERIAILESEISRLKVANRNNIYRLEAIESHLAERHKGANFSKLNSSEIPNTCEPIKPDFIPDWKDAPEDAVCVAMDGNGDWFWYNRKTSGVYGFVFIGAPIKIAGKATNADLLPLNYWKSTLMMRPESISDAPDYTHLLPDGYEFCQEADAEKWVKVEKVDVNDNDEYPIGHIDNFTCFKGRWRPIRPIQYKVTTHEIVTAVPDPYMPDWTKAPEGTVSHAWDMDGRGFWCTSRASGKIWVSDYIFSPFTLPADLDWKQSLRVKPN
jgi:hypothetical protein